jgi:hypothetical protein
MKNFCFLFVNVGREKAFVVNGGKNSGVNNRRAQRKQGNNSSGPYFVKLASLKKKDSTMDLHVRMRNDAQRG